MRAVQVIIVSPIFDDLSGMAVAGEQVLIEAFVAQAFKHLRSQVEKAAWVIRRPDAEPPDGFVNRFREIVDNSCLRILET